MNSQHHSPTPFERLLQLIQALCMTILAFMVPLVIIIWTTSDGDEAASTETSQSESPAASLPIRKISVSADQQYVDVIQGKTIWQRRDAHTGAELQQSARPDLELLQASLHCTDRLCAGVRPPGELFAFGSAGTIWQGSLPDQRPDESVRGCSLCPERNLLAAVSDLGSLWLLDFDRDAVTSQRVYRLEQPMCHVELSPAGNRAALLTKTGELLLWDVIQERLVPQWPIQAGCRIMSWSDDGRRLIGCGHNRQVRVWNVDSGEIVRQWAANSSLVSAIQLSQDGRLAAVGEDQSIRIWNLETGAEHAALLGHGGMITCLHFADEDRALFSADTKGELRRWSVTDRREIWATDSAGDALRQ